MHMHPSPCIPELWGMLQTEERCTTSTQSSSRYAHSHTPQYAYHTLLSALSQYACDGDDKTWLYENKHLPVHGGKVRRTVTGNRCPSSCSFLEKTHLKWFLVLAHSCQLECCFELPVPPMCGFWCSQHRDYHSFTSPSLHCPNPCRLS